VLPVCRRRRLVNRHDAHGSSTHIADCPPRAVASNQAIGRLGDRGDRKFSLDWFLGIPPRRGPVRHAAMVFYDGKLTGHDPRTSRGVNGCRPIGIIKRILEATAATAILLCLSPILLITSVAIGLDSGGPVLIRETRRGYGERTIAVFKFRSATAYTAGDRSSGRLTSFGIILRQTGIEELPQLINVVRGEISLVEALKSWRQ
jgi:hypothetical protein